MFIELTNGIAGRKFLIDFQSGWEITDRQGMPAHWANNTLGMNLNVIETYTEIKNKLEDAGLFVQSPPQGEKS
jgi:hypothetical protein